MMVMWVCLLTLSTHAYCPKTICEACYQVSIKTKPRAIQSMIFTMVEWVEGFHHIMVGILNHKIFTKPKTTIIDTSPNFWLGEQNCTEQLQPTAIGYLSTMISRTCSSDLDMFPSSVCNHNRTFWCNFVNVKGRSPFHWTCTCILIVW